MKTWIKVDSLYDDEVSHLDRLSAEGWTIHTVQVIELNFHTIIYAYRDSKEKEEDASSN